MRCNIKGCNRIDAKNRPTVLLWAKGHKVGSHTPAQMTPEIQFCDAHKGDFDFTDFFPSDQRKLIDESMVSTGKAAFNWSSAKVVWRVAK